jgi:NADH:ubiquinone oxidoreductase subunit E
MRQSIERIKSETGSVVVALQHAMETDGYISASAVDIIAEVFNVSPSEVYSTATFYRQFSFAKKGKNVLSICMGTACFVCGAAEILHAAEKELDITEGEVTADGLFSIERNVRCLGRCAAAPVVCVNGVFFEHATPEKIVAEINKLRGAK